MDPRMLPHSVTVTTPGRSTDGYGNEALDYVTGVTARTIAAYVQPRPGTENTDGRNAVERVWVMFTTAPVEALDRVTWEGRVYEVDGQPQRWDVPGRRTHHYESNLRAVEG